MSDSSAAIRRGIDFLSSTQDADGGFHNLFWYGDAPPVSVANVFPAALLAHSLGFAPEAASVREKALDFLAREASAEGVWSHWSSSARGEFLPPDVDDTACASAALRDGGRPVPPNAQLLFANRDRRGLFYTWFTWRPRWSGLAHWRLVWRQRRHFRKLWPVFTGGTTTLIHNVDAVVNANVLFYLGPRQETAAVAAYLVDVLKDDSETGCDTWYFNRFVIWYFFARALAPLHGEAVQLLRRKLTSAAPATALEIAMAQCGRCYLGLPADERLAAMLRERQLESGAWPAEWLYRGGPCYWGSEALTTAFALEALARGRSQRDTGAAMGTMGTAVAFPDAAGGFS
jgi:hypothetical protein